MVTMSSMDDLDYKPRNSKEKWLLFLVSWGTTILVAWLWREYMKVR